MFTPPPNKKKVVAALESLQGIERPAGDNEGDPINSPSVYPNLSPEDKAKVDHAEQVTKEYVRKPGNEGDEPNSRALTELGKAGFPVSLGSDQYDPARLVGRVKVGDWELYVGDPKSQREDD